MGRAGGLKKFKKWQNVRTGHSVVCVVNEGKGMRFTEVAVIIGGMVNWKVRGAMCSTFNHSGVDGLEDFRNDQTGSESCKRATLDTTFSLGEHVAVKIGATTPECSRVTVTEVAKGQEAMESRVGGHDVAA